MICPTCHGNGYWIEQMRVLRQVRQCDRCRSQGEIDYIGADEMTKITDGDYTLIDGAAWFTVKGFSVRIHSTDEGVAAEIYACQNEIEGALASTYAFDNELNETKGVEECEN